MCSNGAQDQQPLSYPCAVLCGHQAAGSAAVLHQGPQGATPQFEKEPGAGLECGLNMCCCSVCLPIFGV